MSWTALNTINAIVKLDEIQKQREEQVNKLEKEMSLLKCEDERIKLFMDNKDLFYSYYISKHFR